jgi:phosphatidate cytidylyltransferase
LIATGDPTDRAQSAANRDLRFRVLSSVALAAAALATAWAGGVVFAAFWTIAAAGVAAEWVRLTAGPNSAATPIVAGLFILAASVVAMAMSPLSAVSIILAGVFVLGAISRPLAALALPYAAPVALGSILLRADPTFGFAAILWLFAVVWGTDTAAFFVGRALRGPKLWPAISPGKTWSGAIGGALIGTLAGLLVAALSGVAPRLWPVALAGLAASVAAQAGDLFESSVKRRAGVKDSGWLIPGHGGLMDRLDGFTAAAAFAAILGVARAGAGSAGQGLLSW